MLDGLAESSIEFNTVEGRGDSVLQKLDDGVFMGRGVKRSGPVCSPLKWPEMTGKWKHFGNIGW